MTSRFCAAFGLALTTLIPLGATAGTMPTAPGSAPNQITISCYRGPSTAVIWDRPNAVFIDDLVRYGYNYADAQAIADTICRDEYGVGHQGYMTQQLYQLMAKTPPRG